MFTLRIIGKCEYLRSFIFGKIKFDLVNCVINTIHITKKNIRINTLDVPHDMLHSPILINVFGHVLLTKVFSWNGIYCTITIHILCNLKTETYVSLCSCLLTLKT